MSKNIRNESTDGLFQAILSLQDMDECYTFFEDVCTINEIQSLAQRFEVARLLREQKTYGDCRADRGIHRYDQPCEPIIELWQ